MKINRIVTIVIGLVLGVFPLATLSSIAYAQPVINPVPIPAGNEVRVDQATNDNQYILYTTYTSNNDFLVNQYDSNTQVNTVIAEAYEIPVMSNDGQEVVFVASGSQSQVTSNPQPLTNGAVYLWANSSNGATYTQLSGPAESASQVSMSGDANWVAWTANDGDFYENMTTDAVTQVNDFAGANDTSSAILSNDGSTITVSGNATSTGAQAIEQYSTSTNAQVGNTISGMYNVTATSADGSYGTGFAGGKTPGIIYAKFTTGKVSVIPNTYDGQCTGNADLDFAAISGDGQTVSFGSLASGLPSDPDNGSLGYYGYYPGSGDVVNESGDFSHQLDYTDCPSTAVTQDGNSMYFTSDNPVGGGSSQSNSPDSKTKTGHLYQENITPPTAQATSVKKFKITVDNSTKEITLLAKVVPQAGTATINGGTVTFSLGGTNNTIYGTVKVSNGTASMTIPTFKGDTDDTYNALYNGNKTYASSWSVESYQSQ